MDKVKYADAAIPIGKMTQSHKGLLKDSLGKATSTQIDETEDGEVVWSFQWEVEHKERTYGWFFIAADCALEQFNARVTPMTYEIRLLNPGNTHLPVSRCNCFRFEENEAFIIVRCNKQADEYGLPKVYLFVFIGMLMYAAYCGKLLLDQYRKSKKVSLDAEIVGLQSVQAWL